MTRAEILNDIIRITNQDYEAVRRMKAHDRSQREEIARLNEELTSACAEARAIAKIENQRAVAIMELRQEIARLREALEQIKRITQVHSSYLALDVCMIAQSALAKEATRDHAE